MRVHSFALWGSRGPLLRPRRKTQLYVVIGVRPGTLFGQNGPGTREGCTFSKSLFFSSFLKIHAVRRVLRSLGGSWASPGTLWGAPGAQQPDQGHGHFEASFRSCFAVAGGRPMEHQSAKHDGPLCRKPSSRQACVHEPSSNTRFSSVLALLGVQNCCKMMVYVFSSCRGVSKKGPPKGRSGPPKGRSAKLS